MTENEQPQRPQQPSPWARGGGEPGHDSADGAGAVQGGAGASESTGARVAWQGGPARPEEVAGGSAAGVDRSEAGAAGASQGSTPHSDHLGVTGASQDSALRPDSISTTTGFGTTAARGAADEPVPGSPAAQSGAGHPENPPSAQAGAQSGVGPDGSTAPAPHVAGQFGTGPSAGADRPEDFGSPAVQGAGQPGTGSAGAVQGGAGLPGTGQGAWQGGFPHPEQQYPGPYGVPQTHAGQDQPGSPTSFPSGAAQPGPYYAPPGSVGAPPRRGRSKVVAGVAALVLGVGGVSGGVGGYLGYQAADRSGPVTNALNQAAPAQQTGDAPAGSIEQVAQKVLPTVVQVQVSGGAGSGFTLSSDGLVLTNNHVVESAADGGPIKVQLQDGRSFDAKIVGRDPSSDLAVVKAEDVSDLPTAELGNSGDLRIGEQVVAVGSPFDLNGTVTSGIVSSLNRPVRAGGQQGTADTVLNAIQTDAAINPGNSGGPLVNMRGQVVGINSAIYSPNSSQSAQGGSVGIGFAIPVDQARRTAKELAETGKATQTVLGVQVGDAPDGGAQVREVTGGGAADGAGIKSGDVITRFGDRTVDSSDALVAAVRSRAPGEKVQLVLNGGRTVEVTLGSQPVEIR